MELPGEAFDQLAEIDPAFGDEIKHHAFAAEDSLDIHELHLQVMLLDQFCAGGMIRIAGIANVAELLMIVCSRDSKDFSVCGLGNHGNCLRRCRTKNFTTLHAALGVKDYHIAALDCNLGRRYELPEESHDSVAGEKG